MKAEKNRPWGGNLNLAHRRGLAVFGLCDIADTLRGGTATISISTDRKDEEKVGRTVPREHKT